VTGPLFCHEKASRFIDEFPESDGICDEVRSKQGTWNEVQPKPVSNEGRSSSPQKDDYQDQLF
jgi:hypothetical protein